MRVRVKVWIEGSDGGVALSDWRAELLAAVEREGSLVAAARELRIPVRTAWKKIREMEDCWAIALLHSSSGGANGGSSGLTEAGRDILVRYHEMHAGIEELLAERYLRLFDSTSPHRGSGADALSGASGNSAERH